MEKKNVELMLINAKINDIPHRIFGKNNEKVFFDYTKDEFGCFSQEELDRVNEFWKMINPLEFEKIHRKRKLIDEADINFLDYPIREGLPKGQEVDSKPHGLATADFTIRLTGNGKSEGSDPLTHPTTVI